MTEGKASFKNRRYFRWSGNKKERKFKEARLIVRNLPFNSNEENLKEHFSNFGNVLEINLLRKGTGKGLVGCGFVQFDSKLSAAKAIAKASGKPFLDRTIIVDWALSKQKFMKNLRNDSRKARAEEKKAQTFDVAMKEEPDSDCEISPSVKKEEKEDESYSSDEDDSTKSAGGGESDDEETDYEDEDIKPDISSLPKKKSDVGEGRTVFIKNVPFSATEEDLEIAVKKFGPIYYAKICIDKLTEHSRGTAFVKFLSKEAADACLAAGTEFRLNETVLDPHLALPRQEIENKKKKVKPPSDKRNLYLLKEGVIVAGSLAAEGVSEGDMTRRLQLEKWKRQIIKDLGKFVSNNRLVVHNLPMSLEDKKLAAIVKKHAPRGARVTESKIMRDLKNVNARGMGRSKGFGFVTLRKHEDALHVLRSLNNNPSVFKAHRRPIVSFSIESKKALNAKLKRLEKSRQPKPKVEKPEIKIEGQVKIKQEGQPSSNSTKIKMKTGMKKDKIKNNCLDNTEDKKSKLKGKSRKNESERQPFSGTVATPGSKKFMSNLNIKSQLYIHKGQLKKDRAKRRQVKLSRSKRKSLKKENLTKPMKKPGEDSDFNKLVEKYRAQISNTQTSKKWFD